MRLFASIYIGSSEVILKVFEISKDKRLKEIDCLRTQTDLMRDIYHDGKVSLETTDKLCNTLLDMKQTIDSYKCDDFDAFAGYTIRTASNEKFVLEQIKLRTKMDVTSLSNSEHRFLSYQSVASLDNFDELVSKSAVIVDVGGAGLQITLFNDGKVVTTQHVTIGTYYTFASLKKLDRAKDYREQICALIDKELDTFIKSYMPEHKPEYMIIIGDRVAKRISDTDVASDFKTDKDGIVADTDRFIKYTKKMLKDNSNSVNEGMGYIEESNALFEALMILHLEIVKCFDAEKVLIPGVSVNEGIAYDYAYKNKLFKPTHSFENDILTASWSLAKRYGSYEPHLKALDNMSTMIFDAMKKYHNMGKRERLLMRVLCILHDCGKYISISEAASCSYTIIKSSEILGLTHNEREIVALAAEFNRRPLESYDELANILNADEYWIMVQLLAILKVANAMDRSHKQRFKNISMNVKDKNLIISIEADNSISLEKGMFKEKADFFEEIFAIRPVIKEKRVI